MGGRGGGSIAAGSLETQIRTAYNTLKNEPGGYVFLSRLREKLGGSKAEQDAALLDLDLQPGVYLIAETNQKVLTEQQRAQGIWIGGETKHLISFDERAQ